MEHLKMQTADMADRNIERIGELFPECLTERIGENGKVEHAVDFDKLRQLLAHDIVEGPEERYQFTWPDKRKAIRLANAPTSQTLRPCRDESVDFDNTQNLYIEGDNLDVLKLLRENYLGKVKMIYIDPPYNTGNDFVYNDDFAQGKTEFEQRSGLFDEEGNQTIDPMQRNTEANGRFHTDWLNMIYPRLKVARDLLSDDGVIFISIDDNEATNLRKVCDEIYGEDNFVAQISWRRTDNQPNIGFFARVKEYILIYAKSINYNIGRLSLTEKAKAEYRYSDAKGLFRRSILLHKTRGRYLYPKVTKLGNTLMGPWMVPEKEFDRMNSHGEIYWTENGDGQPYGKIYLSESRGQIPNDFWGIEYGTNQRGSLEVEDLFNRRYFDFPKPVSLIYNIIKLGAGKDSVILDFFSGSATTAHAVMQLNAEDGGNRKFIMVQLPENTDKDSEAYKAGYKNICEIGKERIRRAGKKILTKVLSGAGRIDGTGYGVGINNYEEYVKATGDRVLDIGFRVLKIDSSNMADVYYTPAETRIDQTLGFEAFEDNIKPDRTAEDLLFQVMPECNLPLSSRIEEREIHGKRVFSVNDNYLVACFDRDIDEPVITEIAKMRPYYFVMRDASAATDNVLDNFDQIFNAYSKETIRRIL